MALEVLQRKQARPSTGKLLRLMVPEQKAHLAALEKPTIDAEVATALRRRFQTSGMPAATVVSTLFGGLQTIKPPPLELGGVPSVRSQIVGHCAAL